MLNQESKRQAAIGTLTLGTAGANAAFCWATSDRAEATREEHVYDSQPTARLTRREFVKAAGVGGGLAFAGPSALKLATPAVAADATIKVGFLSPLTGPLAGFGETDPHILGEARKALESGLAIGGKRYGVEIVNKDTQSDPVRAGQLAKELIERDKVNMMLSTSTPEVVNPVADACEAAGVPSLSTVMPWEAFYFGRGAKPGQPSPFKWTYLFSFGVADFLNCYVSQWNGPVKTNKKVAALYPNDADGNAIREHLGPALTKAGFTVVDPGGYEDGTTDFSSQIAKFKSENCEILNTFPIPPDFATFWRQAAQQGFTKMVKIAQIAKTGLFPSQVEALGSLGPGLASACYWHKDFPYKSPLTGLASKDIAEGYEKATGRQWTQQLGATMSLFDAGAAALVASGDPTDKASLAKALSVLKTATAVGPIDFTKGPVPNCFNTIIIGNQWVKAKPGSKYKLELVITENANDHNVPIQAQLQPYNA
jgi:branched-chain amino acid transport system substrate-binding protein